MQAGERVGGPSEGRWVHRWESCTGVHNNFITMYLIQFNVYLL